ncbi:MAG: hypothetical protein IPK96_17240 [Flammeovirgaceae bacterium]|nr:hypothetical protein [Flammeovirgaceae bacterium]
MRFKILFISSLLMILAQSLLAQERCGTVQYEKLLELTNPDKEKNLQFENWINQKLTQSATKQLKQQRTGSATYEIPVVIHVIHNGRPLVPVQTFRIIRFFLKSMFLIKISKDKIQI